MPKTLVIVDLECVVSSFSRERSFKRDTFGVHAAQARHFDKSGFMLYIHGATKSIYLAYLWPTMSSTLQFEVKLKANVATCKPHLKPPLT